MVVFGNLKHEYLNRLWSSLALNVLKCRSLSLLELLGPVEGCNGIALPLPLWAG
jgi:hypothetical protein